MQSREELVREAGRAHVPCSDGTCGQGRRRGGRDWTSRCGRPRRSSSCRTVLAACPTIAKRLRVETPSATSMIDRLAAKGLVERGHDPSDRRAVVCSLTQAGMDAIEEFWAQRTARTESLAAVLSTEELEVVVPALEIMADAARRARSRRRKGDHESSDRDAETVEASV